MPTSIDRDRNIDQDPDDWRNARSLGGEPLMSGRLAAVALALALALSGAGAALGITQDAEGGGGIATSPAIVGP